MLASTAQSSVRKRSRGWISQREPSSSVRKRPSSLTPRSRCPLPSASYAAGGDTGRACGRAWHPAENSKAIPTITITPRTARPRGSLMTEEFVSESDEVVGPQRLEADVGAELAQFVERFIVQRDVARDDGHRRVVEA